ILDAETSTPFLLPISAASLVSSRLLISQKDWLCKVITPPNAPFALINGFAPPPYWSIMMGLFSSPDPLGSNCPIHTPPDLNRIFAPGPNSLELTAVSVFQADEGAFPVLASFPLSGST